MLLKKMFVVLVLTALPTLSLAQKQTQSEAMALKGIASPDSVTSCSNSYTSGSGHNLTKYCVTANGNITQFSRGGVEFLNAGALSEGYGVCDFNSGVQYFDYAFNESGNWNPTSVVSSGSTSIKLQRSTSDGIWTLTQTINKLAASAAGPGAAKITMALKNNTAVARSVYIIRHADVDANATSGDDHFDNTLDTAIGLEPSFGGGFSSTSNTFNFSYDAYVQNVFGGPAPCNPYASFVSGPFTGDGSVEQLWFIAIPAGSTKTVSLTYKPI
ncbi:MAG TPA: hypothetical protein VHR84_02195 [Terriglobales bacterium]|jgi:hypothetical protein|nr:hypothetical protein [Terriglobales bacterium]